MLGPAACTHGSACYQERSQGAVHPMAAGQQTFSGAHPPELCASAPAPTRRAAMQAAPAYTLGSPQWSTRLCKLCASALALKSRSAVRAALLGKLQRAPPPAIDTPADPQDTSPPEPTHILESPSQSLVHGPCQCPLSCHPDHLWPRRYAAQQSFGAARPSIAPAPPGPVDHPAPGGIAEP